MSLFPFVSPGKSGAYDANARNRPSALMLMGASCGVLLASCSGTTWIPHVPGAAAMRAASVSVATKEIDRIRQAIAISAGRNHFGASATSDATV
jgi:hypothetical protein